MTVPRADAYQAAIQNPRIAFDDSDLRSSRVATDSLGLPRVASGAFVLTYRLEQPGRSWAVRCFHREVPDLQRRYRAVSDFFLGHPSSIFVPVSYLSDGIRVSGRAYPIIKMPWIQGNPLGDYIDAHWRVPTLILALGEKIRSLARELALMGAAHGDLQHGNIVVENGQLRLVDYDGFYVPKLDGLAASDLGHVNYQLPKRVISDFGPNLDRFSTIVIYLALKATALQPDLWPKYATGENILFSQSDFLDPVHSRLLRDIAKIPALEQQIQRFRRLCNLGVNGIPCLEDFLAGSIESARPRSTFESGAPRNQRPSIDGNDIEQLRRYLDRRDGPVRPRRPTPDVDGTLGDLYGKQPVAPTPPSAPSPFPPRSVSQPTSPPTRPVNGMHRSRRPEPPRSATNGFVRALKAIMHWVIYSGIVATMAMFVLVTVLVCTIALAIGLAVVAGWIP